MIPYGCIPLRREGEALPVGYAIVDEEDYDKIASKRWRLMESSGIKRAVRWDTETKSQLLMYREILGFSIGDPTFVDHVNGDALDNRRANLRKATPAENMQNRRGPNKNGTSGYRGVSFSRRARRWVAQTKRNYKRIIVGYFDTPEEANRAIMAWRAENMPFSAEARKER